MIMIFCLLQRHGKELYTKTLCNTNDYIEYHACRKPVKTAKRNSGGISVFIRKQVRMYIDLLKCCDDEII